MAMLIQLCSIFEGPSQSQWECFQLVQKRFQLGTALYFTGSLWDPDITVCKTETELEVNFTPNSLVPKYRINICETEICQKSAFQVETEPDTKVFIFLFRYVSSE